MGNNLTKDSLLTNDQVPERIKSIKQQIEKLEGVWNPKDYDKHHKKIVTLNDRLAKLERRIQQLNK